MDDLIITEETMEEAAAIEHQRWSDWQRWCHSVGDKQPDGGILLPAQAVARWERQMDTPYEELSEREKQSDREQVFRYIHLFRDRRLVDDKISV